MKTIKARFKSTCAGCGGRISEGEQITGSRGTWYHGGGGGSGCAPSGTGGGTTRGDREYQAGAAEANRYMDDRRFYGEELADQVELEREMREGWD